MGVVGLNGAWLHITINKMATSLDQQCPTLDEILLRHGLKTTDLDKQCPLEVRNEVAVKITDWKTVGHYFNFTVAKIRSIERGNRSQAQCKIALLAAWSERDGEGATYLKLAEVFHRQNSRDLVEFLCEKIKPSIVPLSVASGTSIIYTAYTRLLVSSVSFIALILVCVFNI